MTLAPELDQAALTGLPVAESLFSFDGSPTTVYVRADPAQVTDVQSVLAATANPEHPNEVQVSRPSEALAAQAAAKSALNSPLLGLGTVALLVGVVYLVRRRPTRVDAAPSAEDVHAERYARGEIDAEEYRQRRIVLREQYSRG